MQTYSGVRAPVILYDIKGNHIGYALIIANISNMVIL